MVHRHTSRVLVAYFGDFFREELVALFIPVLSTESLNLLQGVSWGFSISQELAGVYKLLLPVWQDHVYLLCPYSRQIDSRLEDFVTL